VAAATRGTQQTIMALIMRRNPFSSVAARRGRIMHRFVELAVGCGVLAVFVDTWLVEGLLAPVIVTSGSMAPALLGPRRQWRCPACGQEIVCGAESLARPGTAVVCPNCGAADDAEQGIDRPGDRVLIDRSAFLWRFPRRWEAVVFRCPEDRAALCVKRIVGLPGETVQIRQGDVFVDGTIARKGIAQQRSMAVSVYKAGANDQRWQSNSAGAWQLAAGQFVHAGRIANSPSLFRRPKKPAPLAWLTYYHRQCLAPGEPPQPGPVMDASPYDQNESRELNAVDDIRLRCDIRA